LIGGKGESHANIAEGLATALQAFEDLQQKREGTNILTQKHCVLVCNSPPYLMPVMESLTYSGHTTDQLAGLLKEVSQHSCSEPVLNISSLKLN
jgi:mediator of RNA polymerase II transcription subunit 25